jgi:GntR family L-lactate dehydrogenase operon transcriptional regulator
MVIKAWSPFIILTAMVTIWSLKPFKALFASGGALSGTVFSIPVPMLHNLVQKMAPVVAAPALWRGLFLQLAVGHWNRDPDRRRARHSFAAPQASRGSPDPGRDLQGTGLPIYSIGMVLAFAFIANYSGLSTTLAMALAHTGKAFAFFSPFLGWVGVFLTGSDTSANALFGALQATTAAQRGARGSGRDGQHHRRCDRQDDLAPVHRHCLRSRGPGRQGIGPVSLHRQAQPGLPGADRHHLHAAGCVSVDDSYHLKLLPDPMPAIRLSDRVAQQLLELIQSTQLQSGAKLPTERALAEQLGVSRTALREAIQKLASRGVLESRVGAGTFVGSRVPLWHEQAVAPLESLLRDDPQYRYDVLEARQALELSTAWYAAQRATDKDRDRIRRCFDDMLRHQQARDAASAARSDAQFHLAIAEASHNAVLVQLMGSLFELVLGTVAQNRRLMFVHDDLSTLEHLTAQHHNLMQAIVDGEPEQARSAIGQHLAYVHEKLSESDAEAARRKRLDRFSSSSAIFS